MYYVIGTFTQWRFVPMQKLVDLLFQVDPNAKAFDSRKTEAEHCKYYKHIWKSKL